MKAPSKKKILMISLFAILLFFLVFLIQETCNFGARGLCWEYRQFIGELKESTFVLIPLFFLSLITFRLREEVFQSWIRFSVWAIPLSVIFPFLVPDYSGSFMNFGSPREVLQYVLPWLFTFISLVIITVQSIKFQKKPRAIIK